MVLHKEVKMDNDQELGQSERVPSNDTPMLAIFIIKNKQEKD